MLMTGTMRFVAGVWLRCVALTAATVIIVMAWTGTAFAERRLAFVVGIDAYTTSDQMRNCNARFPMPKVFRLSYPDSISR